MYQAPYDKRNAADYKDLSNRIAAALKTLEESPQIAATEKELARLAQCSRGTLRNRAYPLECLKQIRASRNKDESQNVESHDITVVGTKLDNEILLQERLQNSRNEVAFWVDKYKDLESETKRLRRSNELLQAENAAMVTQNKHLRSRLEKVEETLVSIRAKDKVIQFKNGRDRHKEK
ncbi:MAG TPA: hypothetical protein VF666_01080 [Pyrinomonadaceae bacterium]|jgi:hypothetical protein